MAVALPLIASGLSVSAGISAGVATLTGFLQVAGGALTALGALTGKKDLLKVGAVMSLGGAGLNALGAAGAETAAASSVTEAGLSGASEATAAAPIEGLTNASGAMPDLTMAGAGAADTGGLGMGGALDGAAADAAQAGLSRPSLMDAAMQRQPNLTMQGATDPLQEAGSRYTTDSLQKTLDAGQSRMRQMFGNLGESVDKVGAHLQKNRYLYQMGGSMLDSMYGPEAERMDWEKSLLARRLRNLNTPVNLGPRGA